MHSSLHSMILYVLVIPQYDYNISKSEEKSRTQVITKILYECTGV